MNNYSIFDENYYSSNSYQKFIENNLGIGYLKIRAYAANEAIPISGLKIIVSKEIDNNNVIFFEGFTDESGVIDKISLPTPILNKDNLDVPKKTNYKISAIYLPDNIQKEYNVNIYEKICVLQNIIIVPNMSNGGY